MEKITVIGAGYVGLPLSLALSEHFHVYLYDFDKEVIEGLKNKKSPIVDSAVSKLLNDDNNNFYPTHDKNTAYKNADLSKVKSKIKWQPSTILIDELQKTKKWLENN